MTKEECLANDGHCWKTSPYDADWEVQFRVCKHCGLRQAKKDPRWETIPQIGDTK